MVEDLQAQRRSVATKNLSGQQSSHDSGTMTGRIATKHSRTGEGGDAGEQDALNSQDEVQQSTSSPSTLDDNEENAVYTEVPPGSRSDRAFSTGFETAKTDQKSSCCSGGKEGGSSAVPINLCSEELRRPMAVAIAMMVFQRKMPNPLSVMTTQLTFLRLLLTNEFLLAA